MDGFGEAEIISERHGQGSEREPRHGRAGEVVSARSKVPKSTAFPKYQIDKTGKL